MDKNYVLRSLAPNDAGDASAIPLATDVWKLSRREISQRNSVIGTTLENFNHTEMTINNSKSMLKTGLFSDCHLIDCWGSR